MKKLIGGAVILVAAVAAVLWFLGWFAQPLDDERPAMIVKNGSVHFELPPLKGKSYSAEWVDEGPSHGWKSGQPATKGVTKFLVAVTNPKAGVCEDMAGPQIQLTYTALNRPIIVMAVNGESAVRPKEFFKEKNNIPLKQIYNLDAGTITEVQVGGYKCTPNTDSFVYIWEVE